MLRQFSNIASLQMSQIWLKSHWESRKSLKQLILGHFKRDDHDSQPNPTHTVNMCLKTWLLMCWTHPTGSGNSLGFRDTAGIRVAQQPFPGFICTVFSEWNLLGCIWVPWVSKVKFRLFPPEQLHGQGVLQLSRNWRRFEKCTINEALWWLICLLHFDSVPC